MSVLPAPQDGAKVRQVDRQAHLMPKLTMHRTAGGRLRRLLAAASATNNALNIDSQERRFAPLARAGQCERSASLGMEI